MQFFLNWLISWWYTLRIWCTRLPKNIRIKSKQIINLSISERVEQTREKCGNVYCQYDGIQPIFVLGNLKSAEIYYKSFRTHQREYPYLGYVFDQLLKECIGVQTGKDWSALKKPLIKFFTVESLQRITPLICSQVESWLNHQLMDGKIQSLQQLGLEKLTMSILGQIVYGKLSEEELEEFSELFQLHNSLMVAMNSDYLLRYPWLKSFSSNKAKVDEFKTRWSQLNQRLKQKDLMQLVGTLYQEILNSEAYADVDKLESTLYEVVLFNLDIMIDTFAAWIWKLAEYPSVQQTIFEEISGISPEDAHHLPYLTASLNESARLSPGITLTFAETLAEDLVLGKIVLPKGSRISLDTQMINYDPEIWENPHEFSPERFLDTSKLTNSFHRFGLGPRKCLGNVYADRILKILSVSLIQKYQIVPQNTKMEWENRSTIPNLANSVLANCVTFIKR